MSLNGEKNTVHLVRGVRGVHRAYSFSEELTNAITHGMGALAAVIGTVVLLLLSYLFGDKWHLISSSVYGVSLIFMFTSSTLYHGLPYPKAKYIFKIIDHVAIFLFIAGSYTPFTLVSLRNEGNWGIGLTFFIWIFALLGGVLKIFFTGKYKVLSTLVYLGMGHSVLFAFEPLSKVLPNGGPALIVAGGSCYTVGTLFYLAKSLPFTHAIWHLFVLGGSVLHYLAVFIYVIPHQFPVASS